MFKYKFLSYPTKDELHGIISLYKEGGWWRCEEDDEELARGIVCGSHCFLTVLDGENAVGMGRCISDGVSDAYIQDVIVKGDYRKKRIGSSIVEKLVDRLWKDGVNWIGLIAEKGTCCFYKDLGFDVMADSEPMLKRRT